jgi:HPt (histidine-containing phosphotransfer) domain-containing protein
VFDRRAALARLGGEEAFLAQVAGLFLGDSASLLDSARQALARGDSAGARKAAHTLRGSVGYLCAAGVSDAARLLERLSAEGDLAGAEQALRALEQEVDRLRRALADLAPPG